MSCTLTLTQDSLGLRSHRQMSKRHRVADEETSSQRNPAPSDALVLDAHARHRARVRGRDAKRHGSQSRKVLCSESRLSARRTAYGSKTALRDDLSKTGKNPHFARFVLENELEFAIHRGKHAYEIEVTHPSEGQNRKEWESWVAALVSISKEVIGTPGFEYLSVTRVPRVVTQFVPSPPLARTHHVVTVTDAEIADAYDDAEAFHTAWDKIETIKGLKYCVRALDALDEISWLARTFESQMDMARCAKAGGTDYARRVDWDPRIAPWWEYGDLNEEKAGFPALTPISYDEKTKTVEMTGYISKTPLDKGGPEPRHVLVREIYDIRDILEEKRDGDGREIETINVVWPEKWMATSEKRPLLDVGANVFYAEGKKRVRVT